MNHQLSKLGAAIASGVIIATLSAAAKSYVDVEKLKTKVENLVEDIDEIKSDVKWMRNNWHRKE